MNSMREDGDDVISSPPRKKLDVRCWNFDVGSVINHNSNDRNLAQTDNSEVERIRREAREQAKKETDKIHKEICDEAVRENEAKYQKKLQEILQCVICLQVPRGGHIIQCKNGHLMCKNCASNKNVKTCPTCRGTLDKKARNLAVEQIIESMVTFQCQHPNCEFSAQNKLRVLLHERKCEYRLVPCPDG